MSYFQKETAQKLNSGKKSTKTQSKQYEAATVSSSLVNERCQDVLRNIISTDDFASLSNILNYASPSGTTEPLLKTLPGSIDLQLIRFRLSNGVYGQTPELFSSDISQVWKGIISFGKEQVALAQYLSDFSENLFKSKIGSLLHSKDIWDGPMGRGTPDLVKGDRFSSYFCKQSAKDNEVQLHGDSNMRYKPTCMQTYKSRQAAKKEIQSEKSLRPKSIIQDDNLSEACRSCGLILEHNCSVCKHCGAASNTQCIDPPPNNLEDCHLCPEGIVNEDRSREDESPKSDEATKKLCESTGLAGVDLRHKGGKDFLLSDSCEAACHRNSLNSDVNNPPDNSWYCPQCMEDFRYPSEKDEAVNHIPDEYNGSVRTHFPKDTFLEDDIRQNLSVLPSLIGMGSLDENTEQVAAESLTGLGSSSLHDNKVAESQLLLGNDTSSEKCGTENNTLVMSCSFSSNCISLQCLQPPLKTMPHNDWYWPVTTCKVCENDADDERILLCDACDEGYHIYCLNPPVDEKPNGAWLCSYCGPDLTVSKHIEVFKRRKRTEPKCSV
ncbi:hypothetical protein KP509_06G038900 [Ceratopteris richardii]|nr:hypothetical protein KP509_06G038900 [Ceratopteris richardii]